MKRFVSAVEALLIIVLFVTVRAWIGYSALRAMRINRTKPAPLHLPQRSL